MYGCETWIIKKAEHQRMDAFELWCWRRLLRVRWTARKSNQLFLKEISPEYLLEGLMLKLKLQYFGHLMLVQAVATRAHSAAERSHPKSEVRGRSPEDAMPEGQWPR